MATSQLTRPQDSESGGDAGSMFCSEMVTRGIRVRVESRLDNTRSRPLQNQWFFLYTVTISNEGEETAQLVSRHWIITDGEGRVEEVKGRGVVGEQPVLQPGEDFQYTSGCPLTTNIGAMEGSYQMLTLQGEMFQAEVAPFVLGEPYLVN